MKAGQSHRRAIAFLKLRKAVTDTDLARFVGFETQMANRHLSMVCKEGIAHRTWDFDSAGRALVTFNYGPGPDAPVVAKAPKVTVKAWPPLRIVDPWMLPMAFFQGVAA